MITDDDRRALNHLLRVDPEEWALCPPCFAPNKACWDHETRGLIELRRTTINGQARTMMKLTAFGRICLRDKIS
jgi:hypothetical protein